MQNSLKKNREEILEKSALDHTEFDLLLKVIEDRITIIPEHTFLKERTKAKECCPDEKDLVYFALALYLKCGIWSNEKKLKNQNKVGVYATHELIKLFEKVQEI